MTRSHEMVPKIACELPFYFSLIAVCNGYAMLCMVLHSMTMTTCDNFRFK